MWPTSHPALRGFRFDFLLDDVAPFQDISKPPNPTITIALPFPFPPANPHLSSSSSSSNPLLSASSSNPLLSSSSSSSMETGATDGVQGVALDVHGGGGLRRRPADPSSERQVIRWENFLPRRSIRVLLVEHDDSTRHIVAALLRKCSYHVAAVADGLKAWDVLKEKHYSFDLVLTEVAMPSLSGIGLLSKIMGTEECKNIPVISKLSN